MDYRVSAGERAAFKRCRRQWDFGAASRRNLEPVEVEPRRLYDAIRDALATYYYPGMWDWQEHIVLPLVRKAFMRAMASAAPSGQRTADVDLGTDLLERYCQWAPSLDDFGPLWIETDVESLVPDVREPGRALLTDDGRRAVYVDRVAMLAIDAADECWVVMHRVVPDWLDLETLLLDESAVAACWAWEQTYLGMDISGTLYNELSLGALDGLEAAPRHTRTGRPGRGGFSHNEPSGGGRLVPQLRRPARMEGRRPDEERVRQETAGMIRRTRIRRTRLEIETSGQQIGAEVLAMIDPSLAMYPTPSPAHCPECAFVVPCLTMMEGGDPALDLATRFRVRPAETPHEGRLGAGGGGGRYLPIPPPTRR